jgi:hypothetical protein
MRMKGPIRPCRFSYLALFSRYLIIFVLDLILFNSRHTTLSCGNFFLPTENDFIDVLPDGSSMIDIGLEFAKVNGVKVVNTDIAIETFPAADTTLQSFVGYDESRTQKFCADPYFKNNSAFFIIGHGGMEQTAVKWKLVFTNYTEESVPLIE